MNPRIRDERKILFGLSSKTNVLKNNVKTAHWVGHSQLRFLDIDGLFKIEPVVDEIRASVTGNTMKQSVSGEEKNPDLL